MIGNNFRIFMMIEFNLSLLVVVLGLFLYLVLIVVTLMQWGIRIRVVRWLCVFLVFSLILGIGNLLFAIGKPGSFPEDLSTNLPLYGILFLSILLQHLSVLFFLRRPNLNWWVLGAFIIIIILVLDLNFFSIPEYISINTRLTLSRLDFVRISLIIGWGIFMVRTFIRTFQTYFQEELIVTKPRINYWSLGLAIYLAGNIFIITHNLTIGDMLTMLGVMVLTFILQTTRLPDLKGFFKTLLSTLISLILGLVIYSCGFFLLLAVFKDIYNFNPLLISLGIGIVLLVLINPAITLIQKTTRKLLFGEELDLNAILREYSQGVSNVLDMRLLSKVILELISKWIEVDRAVLFTVDTELGENAERCYRLTGIHASGETKSPPGFFLFDSPLAISFLKDKSTITISEIEMLPQFLSLTSNERTWLKRQKMDIFIPVHAKDDWIGILSLGPKTNRTSYTPTEINLLEMLADQTAVALQNARLVDSLVRINNEFRRAYSAMDEAHAKLERLNRTKSDFISISSHELRTPLTVLSGYSQILLEDAVFAENEYLQKAINGIYDGTVRLHEIVDSMLDVAKIDTRALELNTEPINLSALIQQVSTGFATAIVERNLDLSVKDLVNLPVILGDLESLRKVFYHLVSNAIKYTPDNGKISISGLIVEPDDSRFQREGVEIIVSDTGIGIDPRFRELIFTKFYQTGELALHSSGKTKFKGGGPGLGLAIVRGIVQAHGGLVWVESPGYDETHLPGSSFHVILPVKSESSTD
jgi:signal transduction histidine kinase